MVEITNSTKEAIHAVWNAIAWDVYESCEGNNEIAMEMVLDGGRLFMEGYADAQAEIEQLNGQLGVATVREQLAERIQLL